MMRRMTKMGLGEGPGKRYWVHVIKYTNGTLDKCINFMDNNPPRDNTQWYELRPIVKVKEKTCNEYSCSLVEMAA